MSAKKVCIIKHRLGGIGGLEKATFRIIEAFIKKGHEITIITSDLISTPSHPLIKILSFPCKYSIGFLKILEFNIKVKKHLKNEAFDLIFAMDRTTQQTHLRLGNGIHKAYLKTRYHTDSLLKYTSTFLNPLHRLILSIEKSALTSSSLQCLITNSYMIKDQALSFYRIQKEKVHVVHNGVEWHEMQRDFDVWVEKKPKIALSLNLNIADHHFLFIGNGYKRKGLDLLLNALASIRDKSFHLSVIGKDKQQSQYERIVNQLELTNKVSFFGQQKEVRKFYQLADTLIIPSFYDPFANVTVEALAMGLYVLTSSFNGGKEILDESSGQVIDILNPIDFRKKLEESLKQPKTWLKSQKIRESVKHLDFSIQNATLVETCIKNS